MVPLRSKYKQQMQSLLFKKEKKTSTGLKKASANVAVCSAVTAGDLKPCWHAESTLALRVVNAVYMLIPINNFYYTINVFHILDAIAYICICMCLVFLPVSFFSSENVPFYVH